MPDVGITIDLGAGRTIEIRPTTASDADAIRAFYEPFSLEDRHRRFLSAFVPTERWCQDWATIAERGGFGLLAIVRDAGDDAGDHENDTVVAEAGYALQHDGDGEFALAVAPDWRGWLGTYLVDLLVQHAAAAGVANLQAEVLLENSPMLAILRRRGAVDLEHPDSVVRLTIGTGGDPPSWPAADTRRKLLVATAGGRWAGEDTARRAGWATAMCRGPDRRGGSGCPVERGESCPLADGADAIVVVLDPDEPSTGVLVERLRAQRPGVPILAVPGREGAHAVPDGCEEIASTASETFERVLSLVGMPPDTA